MQRSCQQAGAQFYVFVFCQQPDSPARRALVRLVEGLVREVGVERILFASGWPESETGAAMSYLLHSRLGDEEQTRLLLLKVSYGFSI